MIAITKNEAKTLQKRFGYGYGNEGLLHKSHSKNPNYWVTESPKTKKDLATIRKPVYTYMG